MRLSGHILLYLLMIGFQLCSTVKVIYYNFGINQEIIGEGNIVNIPGTTRNCKDSRVVDQSGKIEKL